MSGGTIDAGASSAYFAINWPEEDTPTTLSGTGTIILGASSNLFARPQMTTCIWTVTPGASLVLGEWSGNWHLGGPAANLDVQFFDVLTGASVTLTDAVVRDIIVPGGVGASAAGSVTLTNVTCRVLTLAADRTLTLAGVVTLSGNPVLNAGTLNLGHSTILASGRTISGASLVALTSSGAIIQGGASVVTINNMTGSVGTIFARRWTGTGNGTKVQTLAPHWLLGLR